MYSPALRNSAPPEREKAFFGYVAVVCVVALAIVIPALPELREVPAHSPATYWLLAVLAVVADLRPFPPPGGQRSVVFPSICFTFAILLMWGFEAAVVVQTAAVVASAVRMQHRPWRAAFNAGQYALALEIVEEKGRLHVITRQDDAPAPDAAAEDHYAKGVQLEEVDPQSARAAYEAALTADPNHLEARINLGRLLHLDGRLAEAEQVYRFGGQAEPFLVFNLAVLLEDLGREPEAIIAYREALALDPQFADAHFNLARLYERARDAKASLRHLLAYRRMMDQGA